MIDNSISTFRPVGTVTIAGTTTSANAALPVAAANGVRPQVRLGHAIAGTVAFVAFGGSTVAATTADTPLFAEYPDIFTVPDNCTHLAVILSTGTGNVFATSGFGSK